MLWFVLLLLFYFIA